MAGSPTRSTASLKAEVIPIDTVNSAAHSWISYAAPNPLARVRLFCFPFAGGSASTYRMWRGGSLANIEVLPIQLPGREERFNERRAERIGPLVATLADVLPFDRPFALFGHSMGALIAFELARELRRREAGVPVHLFVSGAPAAQQYGNRPRRFAKDGGGIIDELRQLGGTPDEILDSEEFLRLIMPTLQADFGMVDAYRYVEDAPLSCPITAFGGDHDPEVSPEGLSRWAAQTTSRFDHHVFPGGHFFLHEHAQAVQAVIGTALA